MKDMDIYGIVTGFMRMKSDFYLFPGQKDRNIYPVMSYLIKVEDQTILFDTGISPNIDLGVFNHFLSIETVKGHDLVLQMKSAGSIPTSLSMIVNSHLHFDHCANNALFKDIPIVVQKKEYNSFTFGKRNPMYLKISGFKQLHFQVIDGDTSWTVHNTKFYLMQAFGHSAGQQIMAIENEKYYVLLLADSGFLKDGELFPIESPGITGYDTSALTVKRIKQIIQQKASQKTVCLFCSHDITNESTNYDISMIASDVLHYRF